MEFGSTAKQFHFPQENFTPRSGISLPQSGNFTGRASRAQKTSADSLLALPQVPYESAVPLFDGHEHGGFLSGIGAGVSRIILQQIATGFYEELNYRFLILEGYF